jgi:hypothetical protein
MVAGGPVVLVRDPVAQAGRRRDVSREGRVEDCQRTQIQERLVVVGRRRLTGFRDQVEVDVDHAPDDALEVPLGRGYADARGQEAFPRFTREHPHLAQVFHDQHDLARHELGVDHRAAPVSSIRFTYLRSTARKRL